MNALSLVAALALVFSPGADAHDLEGPGRFCGYSPIIDLLPGEKITVLEGGIHGGTFRWEGSFGSLNVHGIGWAGRPKGRIVQAQTSMKPARFAQRRANEGYEIAIWNGGHGAAYFSSASPLNALQIKAIGRVMLFEELQSPTGCTLRTMFSWDG